MRKFIVLLKKEIRELATAQVLLPFVLTILMFVLLGNVIGQQREADAERPEPVAIVDLDASSTSTQISEALKAAGYDPVELDPSAGDSMAQELRDREIGVGIVVPQGFETGLASGMRQKVETYAQISGFSYASAQGPEVVDAVLEALENGVSDQLIAAGMPGSNPEEIKHPIERVETVIVGDRSAKASMSEVFGFIIGQTTLIPIVLFLVIMFAAQMIATTIASEKENKTLETLLSSPIDRTALIGAKITAAGLIALVSAAVYMLGMRYYMNSLAPTGGGSAGSGAAAALGLSLTPVDYVLLGVTLFFAIMIALAAAVILGAFAENVKAAQSLLTPLMIFLMIPYLTSLLIDLDRATPLVRWLVNAIPFTAAFQAAPSLFLGEYGKVGLGIAYEIVWCVGLILVAGRIFASDRILTMKLDLRRKRTR
ncbi:MAG: ABC transporter permease [Actinomycetota bacterium]|nr:ABC transporter permease [Actinomycetota bacterium]